MAKRSRRKRQVDSFSLPDLPPNVRLTIEPDRLEIVYTCRYWIGGLRMLLFGFFWTAITIYGTVDEYQKGLSWGLLGMLPFQLVSLFFIGLAARNYFHREVLRIDADGLDWRLSTLIPVLHRHVPWDRLVGIQKGLGFGARQLIKGWGLGVETNEKTFNVFLNMQSWNEGNILKHKIDEFIVDYRQRHAIAPAVRDGESQETKIRRRDLLRLYETPEYVEIVGTPSVPRETKFVSLLFLVFWPIGCILLTPQILATEPNVDSFPIWLRYITVIVFWSPCFFIFPMMLCMFWRHESLRIDENWIEHRQSIRLGFVTIPYFRRRIPTADAGFAESYAANNGNYNESGIEIPTTGRKMQCFKVQKGWNEAKDFLDALNARLEKYGVTEKSRFRNQDIVDSDILDSRWTYRNDGIVQIFVHKGRIWARTLGLMLFTCVFINGILSLVIASTVHTFFKGDASTLLLCIVAIIVTPFLFFGVLAVLETLLMLLQFLCRYTITLDERCVSYRRCWLGIGFQRSWFYSDIGKVKVFRHNTKLRMIDMIRNPELANNVDGMTNPYPFAIRFFNIRNEPLGMIPDLLEGEARWIARHIRERCRKN